jgi:hypothetical protein
MVAFAGLTLFELVRQARERLDDLGGDGSTECAWQNDDTGLLWANHELVAWANEAQREFCRRRPISDSDTAALCTVAVASGTDTYDYDDRILFIKRAKLNGEQNALTKRTQTWMDRNYPEWESMTGTPVVYVEDFTDYSIRLIPNPDDAFTLDLVVARLPIDSLRWEKRQSQRPEIANHQHESLLHWICHRAYLKKDSQTYDEKQSERALALFNLEVGPPIDARELEHNRMEATLTRKGVAYFY